MCVAVGVSVRDPQQHVGQEWFADQRAGDDLCAVPLLQLHDWPWHLFASGWHLGSTFISNHSTKITFRIFLAGLCIKTRSWLLYLKCFWEVSSIYFTFFLFCLTVFSCIKYSSSIMQVQSGGSAYNGFSASECCVRLGARETHARRSADLPGYIDQPSHSFR